MHQVAESYHRDIKRATTSQSSKGSIHDNIIAKEANLDKILHVDKSPRYMLLDHFLPARTSLKSVQKDIPEKGNLSELGFTILKKKNIILTGSGKAFNSSIQIKKKLSLKSNILNINIELKNQSNAKLSGLYACELNYSLLGGHSEDRYFLINDKKPTGYYLDSTAIEQKTKSITIVNEYDKFAVETKFKE